MVSIVRSQWIDDAFDEHPPREGGGDLGCADHGLVRALAWLGHGIIWLVDDAVFSAFFVWRRDTWACVLAHAVPNFLAATLVATGVAT